MVILTKENFDEEVLQSKVPVAVMFTAPWDNIGQNKLQQAGNTIFGTVDFDSQMELVQKYAVRIIPYTIQFVSGVITSTLFEGTSKSGNKN